MDNPMTKISSKLTNVAAIALGLLAGTATVSHAAGATVAFLMPDQGSTRYEEHDAPGFIAEMKKLCESKKHPVVPISCAAVCKSGSTTSAQ